MLVVGLFEYSQGSTVLHRANPVAKLSLAASLCVATSLAAHIPTLLAIIAVVLLGAAYAGVGGRALALVRALAVLAALMLLVQTAIVRSGEPVILWVTDRGLDLGAHVALRLVAFAMPLVLMLSVTRMSDLTNAAVEVLHLPYRYAFAITCALRFVPILAQEMARIVEAQTARGLEVDSPNPVRRLRLTVPLVAPMLIGAVGRADATALAAEQRGFYLRGRDSSYKRYPMRARDVALLGLCLVVIVLGAAF